MEAWSGTALKSTAIYGIRVYRRGSILFNHVDRFGSHVVSAAINVGQMVRHLILIELSTSLSYRLLSKQHVVFACSVHMCIFMNTYMCDFLSIACSLNGH